MLWLLRVRATSWHGAGPSMVTAAQAKQKTLKVDGMSLHLLSIYLQEAKLFRLELAAQRVGSASVAVIQVRHVDNEHSY